MGRPGASTRVLLISGSTRARSTNSSLVRTALVCTPPGVTTARYGMTGLPYVNPDDDHEPLPPSVAALRGAVGTDGLLDDRATRDAVTDVLRTLAAAVPVSGAGA